MILFDGCSYTYGDELENPEKEAFPHLVARMGLVGNTECREYVSLGECGKSNDGITRTTIKYCEKNKVDIAVIQFTIYSRREIYRNDKNKWKFISCQYDDNISDAYYKIIQNKSDDLANFHKNKFILENSDQFKLSDIIIGSQGFCFFITLFSFPALSLCQKFLCVGLAAKTDSSASLFSNFFTALVIQSLSRKISVHVKKTHISKCCFVLFSKLSNAYFKVVSVVELS